MSENDPAILFVKPNAIRPADKRKLREAGILVIEVADPASIKFTRARAELNGSDLLVAALKAIKKSGSDHPRLLFSDAICAAIELSNTKPPKTEESAS